MAEYAKPWLSVTDQVEKLRSRGLIIADEDLLTAALRRIGYYRLSIYTYSFRRTRPDGTKEDNYVSGVTAEDVVALYEFDRRLRLILLSALERVEIATRFSVAYVLGERDPFGHLDAGSLGYGFRQPAKHDPSRTKHDLWLDGYQRRQQDAQSREEFVRHFASKYNSRLPIWTAVEIMQFGELSTLYQGLRPTDRDVVSGHYGLSHRTFASWLHHLAYVRNVCAHHARLWNRPLVIQPKRPPKNLAIGPVFAARPRLHTRVMGSIILLDYLMKQIHPDSGWFAEVGDHLGAFPESPVLSQTELGCRAGETAEELFRHLP